MHPNSDSLLSVFFFRFSLFSPKDANTELILHQWKILILLPAGISMSRYQLHKVVERTLLWILLGEFFEGFHLGSDQESGPNGAEVPVDETLKRTTSSNEDASEKHARLYGAIYSFRDIGHTQGTFDPIKEEVEENPRLSMARLGFDPADLKEIHFTGNYLGGVRMQIGEIFERLKKPTAGM